MAGYQAPLREMRFVLCELWADEAAAAASDEFPGELVASILEAAARFSESVLHPINRRGDEEGCTLANGVVRTPPGFVEAYRAYREGGWASLACAPEFGGQGAPHALRILVEEMIASANLAFASYTFLCFGAYTTLYAHAPDPLKQAYLPKLVDGTWMGTMCLTEAQCGSDLSLLRTRAAPRGDGGYAITGSKIFISAGEHDLAENILHLVLARLPDAPPGTRGISLFLVPKLLLDDSGRPTIGNAVTCIGLEHKMGQLAAATCALEFEAATGWLIGEPNRGLPALFKMMNTARIGAAVQGLAIAEASYQGAVTYARERRQGRAASRPQRGDSDADPIIAHPDVQRMLLTIRSQVEGMRALAMWLARALDRREWHPDPRVRAAADALLALMTPVVKAGFTDTATECANIGVQVLGGHGYIRDHGMEQYVRDVRITQIYDGTNGIQAIDLVFRKLPRDGLIEHFLTPARALLARARGNPQLADQVAGFAAALARLERVTGWIIERASQEPDDAAAVACDYLRLFWLVAMAFAWLETAAVAARWDSGDTEGQFYRAKLATARFFYERLLPHSEVLAQTIVRGASVLRQFEEAAF